MSVELPLYGPMAVTVFPPILEGIRSKNVSSFPPRFPYPVTVRVPSSFSYPIQPRHFPSSSIRFFEYFLSPSESLPAATALSENTSASAASVTSPVPPAPAFHVRLRPLFLSNAAAASFLASCLLLIAASKLRHSTSPSFFICISCVISRSRIL